MIENESVYYTYATNAVEGSTLSLSETTVVLVDGVTIGGKTVREHLDAVHGQQAYLHMLDLARGDTAIDEDVIKDLHAYVVGLPSTIVDGLYRTDQRYIFGSFHVPPASEKVRSMMGDMAYRFIESPGEHPVARAAALHFGIVSVHPFPDYNGRTARLAMNLALIRSGYPPVVVLPGEEKARYIAALESSHRDETAYAPNRVGHPRAFIAYVASLVAATLQRYLQVLGDDAALPLDDGGSDTAREA
jgi:Fic family protein